ncbi:MAG TPA: hypothetical protein DCL41_07010 [Bdellovibrionales bacterium]|nr:hypothetical protein [Bdellovibrionales bacterium]
MKSITLLLASFVLFSFSFNVFAWGRRGHAIVCQTAAYLASQDQPQKEEPYFLKVHSFDLGYYCNVPDIIWKRPATYKLETSNHFMDLEPFDKKFDAKTIFADSSPYRMSRVEFDEKHKDLPEKYGRSWWRIQELDKKLSEVTEKLKKGELKGDDLKTAQAEWLMLAGVIGHYIGDLAMPLHVSENYDGQMTDQKGIHDYFEEALVDELFLQSHLSLQESVYKRAISLWKAYEKKAKGKDLLTLAIELSKDSQNNVDRMLKIDKKQGRKSLKKSAQNYRELIVDRLAKGALLQAQMMSSHLGWEFDGKKFYNFIETPAYIEAPKSSLPKK